MAHELQVDPVTGEIPLFYYGQLPWHGLGRTLTEDRPATAKEAIEMASLDWRAEKYPAFVKIRGSYYPMPDTYGVVRGDTVGKENAADPMLPIVLTAGGKAVSDQYVPLQNVEAFEFFDEVVGQGAAIYHTAGYLRKGDRVWILAKLPDTMSILGMDDIEPYVLLTNSHDGTSSIQIMLTMVRVVCANTLRWAMGDGMREMKIRHTANAKEKLERAVELMGVVRKEVAQTEAVFNSMANFHMSKTMFEEYAAQVYPAPEPNDEGIIPKRTASNYEKRMDTLLGIFERGPGADMKSAKCTLFGGFNAVTDYVDHYGRKCDASVRMESVLAGYGDGIKQRAFKIAQEAYLAA